MEKSVVVFLFVGNNHISNVKSLQSIYRQDYEKINLIICNDCTYGFKNERLLNNFGEKRGRNIRQVVFHENTYPIGEYKSLLQFRGRINGDFIVILHAGEYFVSSKALRECVDHLIRNPWLDMVLAGAENWNANFTKRICVHKIQGNQNGYLELDKDNLNITKFSEIRDCMAIYRIPVFYENECTLDQGCIHTSKYIVPELVMREKRVGCIPQSLCQYSDRSVYTEISPVPNSLGSTALHEVEMILDGAKSAGEEKIELFSQEIDTRPKKQKRNLWIALYQLSTLKKIKIYAIFSMMMFIAAGLLLNVEPIWICYMGITLLGMAIFAMLWAVFMTAINLYLKKNPQRLVNHNGR